MITKRASITETAHRKSMHQANKTTLSLLPPNAKKKKTTYRLTHTSAITGDEVNKAIQKLTNNKSPHIDT